MNDDQGRLASDRSPARRLRFEKLRIADMLRRTDALAMYQDFLTSQWLSPAEITQRQGDSLAALVDHAYEHVPYYREIFDQRGLKPTDVRCVADLHQLPVLTKDIVRREGANLHAQNMDDFQPRSKATGGSTGHPLKYYIDRRSHSAQWAFIYRAWHAGGWRPGDRVVFIGGSSLAPSANAMKKSLYAKLNSWLLLEAFNLDPEKGRWVPKLRRFDARFMYAYASSAYLVARYVEEAGITDLRFDAVYTTAEVLHPHFRSTIERAFSCEVFDLYGGSDGAGYGFECEEHDGLHHVAENSIVEFVDEAGRVVEEGEEGRVLSTDLFSWSMPFIRYDTGDLSSMSDRACPCGRGLPLFDSIKGRSTDYVTLPSGARVHAQYFMYLFRDYEWISQFYVVQEREDLVAAHVKPTGSAVPADLARLRTILAKKLAGLDVELIVTDEIPTTAGGKHRFVVNKTDSPA